MKYKKVIEGASAREAVLVMISDPFVADFAEAIPVTLVRSEVVEEQSGTWHHVMACEIHTAGYDLDAAIKKVLPKIVRLSWEQTWTIDDESNATALLHISTHGRPSATTRGTAHVAAETAGLQYSFEGQTKVSVPFIGPSLASRIDQGLITDILDDQVEVLARHLRFQG